MKELNIIENIFENYLKVISKKLPLGIILFQC